MIDRETLSYFGPYAYLRDLLRDGFVVRYGGQTGTLVYSEGWRNARFLFEVIPHGVSVDFRSTRWWRLPFGIPFVPLTESAKTRILARLQRQGNYVPFEGPVPIEDVIKLLSRR
jgi:hypothetical protein